MPAAPCDATGGRLEWWRRDGATADVRIGSDFSVGAAPWKRTVSGMVGSATLDERIARIGARLAGRASSPAGDTGANEVATPRLQRARDQWGNPIAVALAIVIGALGVAFFIAAGNQVGWTRVWFNDLQVYRDATARLLAGDGWYLQRQLGGPYQIQFGDVLNPPVTAWFFMPWLVLPG